MKIKAKYLFFIFIISLFFYHCQTNINVYSSEVTNPTELTISNASMYPNNVEHINVRLDNVVNISALEFTIYYDINAFEITNVGHYSLVNQSLLSINYDTPGEIRFHMINDEGIVENGYLMYFYVKAKQGIPIKNYSLNVTIGEAYDRQMNDVQITGINGSIVILNPTLQTSQFYTYSTISDNSITNGQTTQLQIYSYDLKRFAAGTFELFFDRELLEVESVILGDSLNHTQSLNSINISSSGAISISYVSTYGIGYAYPMLTIRFKAIANLDTTTSILIRYKDCIDENFNSLKGNEITQYVNLKSVNETSSYPRIYVSDYAGDSLNPFDVYVRMDEGSNIAAGDFVVNYDASKIKVISIEIHSDVIETNSFLTYHPTYDNGIIRFSLINENGLIDQMTLLKITFEPVTLSNSISTEIQIIGSGIVNHQFMPISLSYPTNSIKLGTFFKIDFIDDEDNLLTSLYLEQNATINAPVPPKKIGKVFERWSEEFDLATKNQSIKAIYREDISIKMESKIVFYDKQPHQLEILNVPSDAKINYQSQQSYTDAGTYEIIATISLDGHMDLILSGRLIIQKAPLTIRADDKDSIFGDPLKELTYSVVGTIYGDYIPIELVKELGVKSGTYSITIVADHPNYDIITIPGTYLIRGIDIDVSGLQFTDATYVFDNSQKEIILTGELPTGVISYEYKDNSLINAGTSYAMVKFEVEENYNPIPNMVAILTIEKADIMGINLESKTFVYDSKQKSLILNHSLTQHGIEVNVVYSSNYSQVNAGTYNVSAVLTHPNYDTLTLDATLVIEKASRKIDISQFTVYKTSQSIEFSTLIDDVESVMLSIDGEHYQNSLILSNLIENSYYEITLYVNETSNFLASNFIVFKIYTYLSKQTMINNISNVTTINLNTRDVINGFQIKLENIDPTERAEVELAMQSIITRYNTFVKEANNEYLVITSIKTNSYPALFLSTVSLGWVVMLLLRRRII